MNFLDDLEARLSLLPDEIIEHEGDCCGSLCPGCGHCVHSIVDCEHDCDGQGGGCRDALDSDEVLLRKDALRAVSALRVVFAVSPRSLAEIILKQ